MLGSLLLRHIAVHSQIVLLLRAIKFQLGRVTSRSDDLVALGQTLLDEFRAEAGRGTGDEKDLWCHCLKLMPVVVSVVVGEKRRGEVVSEVHIFKYLNGGDVNEGQSFDLRLRPRTFMDSGADLPFQS